VRPPARVVFAVDSPTYGGAEQCVIQLLRGLPPDLARAVVATEPVPGQLVAAAAAAGAPLIRVGSIRGTGDGAERVAAAIAGLRPDVVHVNFIDPRTCVELLEGAVAAGAPVVVDVHMTGGLDAGTDLRRLGAAYAGVTAVVARSRRVAAELLDVPTLPPSRVHVVRNGVPVDRPEVRQPRGAGPFRVRSVGRLTVQKGFDVLVAATRELLAAGVAVDVAVAGRGREMSALVEAAAGLPVRFVGFVDDVPGFLAGCDAFCLPSRAEALPLALLEAAVAGLPCVATDVGDIGSALGDIALVVPPEDPAALAWALRALATDDRLRERLAARARAVGTARFDERRAVAAIDAVYRAALARPARATG
jgi:glycosyltransferase involved in cell wall biosynthesis